MHRLDRIKARNQSVSGFGALKRRSGRLGVVLVSQEKETSIPRFRWVYTSYVLGDQNLQSAGAGGVDDESPGSGSALCLTVPIQCRPEMAVGSVDGACGPEASFASLARPSLSFL